MVVVDIGGGGQESSVIDASGGVKSASAYPLTLAIP